MTFSLFIRMFGLVCGLILAGLLLCLPLYAGSLKKLLGSSLGVKILWWIPIFGVLSIILFGGIGGAISVTVGLLYLSTSEFIRSTKNQSSYAARIYFAFFVFASLHLIALYAYFGLSANTLLITIAFASVMSDVVAFFLGTYAPKHPLPKWINRRKSWEGVFGQLIGPFIGGWLVIAFLGFSAEWWLYLAVGLASAFGDLFNSVAKRSLTIKDWGNTIPGHGGVLDRMSSLSTSIFVVFWLISWLQ